MFYYTRILSFVRLYFVMLIFLPSLNSQPLYFHQLKIPGVQPFLTIDYLYQDSKGLIWIGTFGGLFSYDGYSLTHYTNQPGDSTSLGDNKIRCIHEDPDGQLWIGTQQGLYSFDPRKRIFRDFTKDLYTIGYQSIYRVFPDSSEYLWILAQDGLYSMSLDNYSVARLDQFDGITDLTIDSQGRVLISDSSGIFCKENDNIDFEKKPTLRTDEIGSINGVLEFRKDNFWVVTDDFILHYNINQDSIYAIYAIPELSANPPILSILVDNLIIISRDHDLLIFDTKTKEYHIQPVDSDNPADPIKNATGGILLDRQNQIWIGNSSGYPYVCDLSKRYFHHIPLDIYARIPFIGNLFQLFEFTEGKLLVPGLEKPELLNISSGTFEPFPYLPSPAPLGWNNMTAFLRDESKIWIGTSSGLLLYDTSKSDFIDFENGIKGIEILRGKLVRDLILDTRGNLWVATWWYGVYKIDFESKTIWTPLTTPFSIFYENPLGRSLFEDSKGNMWIGTRSGLFKYLPDQDTFSVYRHNPNDLESISENTAFCIYEDTLGYIWIGTYGGGLNRLDPKSGKFTHVTQSDGLLNNNVFCLIPDAKYNLWLLSFDGVTRFNPYNFQMINLTRENGLGNTAYDGFLYGKSRFSGKLFFGGRQGIDIFHPDSIQLSDFKPPILFTNFELFNEPVSINRSLADQSKTFTLDQDISFTKEITLNYNHRVFTIDYTALDFSSPENIQYAYRLDGFDSDWQYVESKRSATYTNLDPGNYQFQVKSTNADGVWNEEFSSLGLIVTPPWWSTSGAYFFYLLFLSGIIYFIYQFQQRRWRLQMALQLQEKESQRLTELDTLKSNLYTNITHEFRTPLTVIDGTIELMRENPKKYFKKGLSTIKGQSHNLLEMVNQILELQRFESGNMNYHPVQDNIIPFINYIGEPFLFQAKAKGLDFELVHDREDLVMDFDPDKLSLVISNLLANAIKYTDQGKIGLSTRLVDNSLTIRISDTGMGISNEEINLIFDRFYQTEQGNNQNRGGAGIGLALVREVVPTMQGKIDVDSSPGVGTEFILSLLISNTAEKISYMRSGSKITEIDLHQGRPYTGFSGKSDTRILIIEDNPDVRYYLRNLLEDRFQIDEADDGNRGLEKANVSIPDLIISDIMMPGKDGYQVCEELHLNPLTEHIPIILLTAKADQESALEGYRQGADVYLIKPFHPDELRAQIEMLLKQRKRLQKKYSSRQETDDFSKHLSADDRFLARVYKLVLASLSDDEFGIEDICEQMGVSRSQLHNKIKAITGLSTSIFIRKIRLEEARKLIFSSELNVSEIAFKVGFSDPNFFSRVYKKEFGESPRESRK